MKIGYDLVKEQLFFRQELKERVFWLIHLRWIAVGSGLALSWAFQKMGGDLPIRPIIGTLIFCAFYNISLLYIGKRLEASRPSKSDLSLSLPIPRSLWIF